MTLEDEVHALLVDAANEQQLDSTLQSVFDQYKQLLFDNMKRQVDLLQFRSQDLNDAQVTVYDKVLLALTAYGEDLESPAAITWYCSQYLGYDPSVPGSHDIHAIEQRLALPAALAEASTSAIPDLPATSSPKPKQMESPILTSPARKEATTVWSTKDNISWQRFCDIYDDAVNEYNRVSHKKNTETHDAARFLRDTAENGMHFLERFPNLDQAAVGDLKQTYNMAQRMVEEMTGGKKRKFDHYADIQKRDRADREAAAPTATVTATATFEGDRSTRQHRVEAESSEGHERRARDEPSGRVQVRERHRESAERARPRPRSQSPGRDDDDHHHRHHHHHHHHHRHDRGHSRIPYGYSVTRSVDSYVPARDGPIRRDRQRRR